MIKVRGGTLRGDQYLDDNDSFGSVCKGQDL